VISGRETDVLLGAQRPHPGGRRSEFGRQSDVHCVSSHGYVIRRLVAQIRDQIRQHRHIVRSFAPALPIDETHKSFGGPFAQFRHWHRPKMWIGKMGNNEAHKASRNRVAGRRAIVSTLFVGRGESIPNTSVDSGCVTLRRRSGHISPPSSSSSRPSATIKDQGRGGHPGSRARGQVGLSNQY
jgi:hypothetical protein